MSFNAPPPPLGPPPPGRGRSSLRSLKRRGSQTSSPPPSVKTKLAFVSPPPPARKINVLDGSFGMLLDKSNGGYFDLLPPELFQQILGYLPFHDMGNLALTSEVNRLRVGQWVNSCKPRKR